MFPRPNARHWRCCAPTPRCSPPSWKHVGTGATTGTRCPPVTSTSATCRCRRACRPNSRAQKKTPAAKRASCSLLSPGLEVLREPDPERTRLRGHDVRLVAAGVRRTFGKPCQLGAFVERILEEEVQRPVALPETSRQVGQRVRRQVAEQVVFRSAQVRPAIALVDYGRLSIGFATEQVERVTRRHVALEACRHR